MSNWPILLIDKVASIPLMTGTMSFQVDKNKEWQWLDFSIINPYLLSLMNAQALSASMLKPNCITEPNNCRLHCSQFPIDKHSSNSMKKSSDSMEKEDTH